MACGAVWEAMVVEGGIVFGEYSYGENLGFKILDVPLVIGLNWLILVYSSAEVAKRWSNNIWLVSLFASSLMLGLDFIIEPVAIQLDFWTWANEDIPIQNYLAWFVIAFAMQLLLFKINSSNKNTMGIFVFIV